MKTMLVNGVPRGLPPRGSLIPKKNAANIACNPAGPPVAPLASSGPAA